MENEYIILPLKIAKRRTKAKVMFLHDNTKLKKVLSVDVEAASSRLSFGEISGWKPLLHLLKPFSNWYYTNL